MNHDDAHLLPYAQVAIETGGAAGRKTYTYLVPEAMRGAVQRGSRVLVPFGPRKVTGYVVELVASAPTVKLRPIIKVLGGEEELAEWAVELAEWIAEQYRAPRADCLKLFTAPGGRRKTEEVLRLTADDLSSLARAPRRKVVAEALRELGGQATVRRLVAHLRAGSWPEATPEKVRSALRALEGAGMVERTSAERAPTVRPLERKQVRVADAEVAAQALAELELRAPRQALELGRILAAHPHPVAASELAASAVNGLRRRGLVVVEEARQLRRPDGALEASGEFLSPLPAQQAVIKRVSQALGERAFVPLLLHGVTGSGKTEVYLHSLRATLEAGRKAIVLVPEISLTPQIVGRITARFGTQAALLHSALSPGERYDEWQRLRRGEASIAVGPRSALFAPLEDVGLIVIDEEHETAYKQESPPRYHARTVAWERARRHKAVLLLGSATPDVCTYWQALQGEMELFELPERVDARPLPEVHIVDLSQDVFVGAGRTFSEPLLAALETTLERGEQAILFLNRRGFSTYVACRDCGWRLECPHCGVSLTYHHGSRQVICHYCGYSRRRPDRCESCGSDDVGFMGLGTERVAEQLQRHFPKVRAVRMDRDTVRRKGAHRDLLATFASGEAQVLIGTQMVAKGLDFPGVTLVGVINADVGLAWPDFRAVERTFQLLTQVAGRAGRAEKPGIVIIQTYKPEHPALRAAARHDYKAFYEHEIEARRRLDWPPFSHVARLLFTAEEEGRAKAAAQTAELALIKRGIPKGTGEVHYLGPAPAPLERLRGQWRYHLVLKATWRENLLGVLDDLLAASAVKQARPVVDLEPVDLI